MTWLWVALGGAVGTLLRYGVGVWFAPSEQREAVWPWSTFSVNIVGSLVLAFVFSFFAKLGAKPGSALMTWQSTLGVGLLGGFTTYSSFNLETLKMLMGGQLARASLYVVATVLCCLVVSVIGFWVGKQI